jgi:adenosylcobinamide-GDP ribazoletransferase
VSQLLAVARGYMSRALRALVIALAFLTRVPVPARDFRADEFGAAASCFPLVGFGIGVMCWGVHALFAPQLGASLTALAVLVFAALITGGLHLDGLADWFDALGGGQGQPSRMLEIMRDPRVGAHGASALVVLLLGKLIALAEQPEAALPMSLLCAPALSRLWAVWLMHVYPTVRADGLGQALAQHVKRSHALIATATAVGGALWFGPALAVPLLASFVVAALLGAQAQSRLGGLTGDIYGAAIEASELAFLVAARASWHA